MSKHLVDIDEAAFTAAKAELGSNTIKDTINAALRRAGAGRDTVVDAVLDTLADLQLEDRQAAWRCMSSTRAC